MHFTKYRGNQFGLLVNGDAKAKVNGALGKLADVGVEGTGLYQSNSSKGVLQKDLASVIEKSNDCRRGCRTRSNAKASSPSRRGPYAPTKGRRVTADQENRLIEVLKNVTPGGRDVQGDF